MSLVTSCVACVKVISLASLVLDLALRAMCKILRQHAILLPLLYART